MRVPAAATLGMLRRKGSFCSPKYVCVDVRCREKSDHHLLELNVFPRLPVLNQAARQFVNLDPVYLSEFLAKEGMGFSDRGPLAASLPVTGSYIWMLHGCSGASLVLGGGKRQFNTSLE